MFAIVHFSIKDSVNHLQSQFLRRLKMKRRLKGCVRLTLVYLILRVLRFCVTTRMQILIFMVSSVRLFMLKMQSRLFVILILFCERSKMQSLCAISFLGWRRRWRKDKSPNWMPVNLPRNFEGTFLLFEVYLLCNRVVL